MKEEFLHFIWKNRLLIEPGMITTRGEEVSILNPGIYNMDSGPDFLDARIRIGDTVWAGNVEIHIKSSAWKAHGHHLDPAYENVILHAVADFDSQAETSGGRIPDTMVMKWDHSVYTNWIDFLNDPSPIHCSKYLERLEDYRIVHAINKAAIDRLMVKSEKARDTLNSSDGDWEEALYRLIAQYFGMNVNNKAFARLAEITPLRIARKYAFDPIRVEALFMGQAGFLSGGIFRDDTEDEYYRLLAREYRVLRAKYSFTPMQECQWRFHRMRPANFPTIRISQLAALITRNEPLFSIVKSAKSATQLAHVFTIESSGYWEKHYRFGKSVKKTGRQSGTEFIQILIINAVLPLLFLYGKTHAQQEWGDICIDIEEGLPAENNRITRIWKAAGVEALSSFESQGLINMYNEMCKKRRCLNCLIGSKLISLGKDIKPWQKFDLGEN